MPSPLLAPFRGLRPAVGRAADVVARPYDVVTFDEAKEEAAGRPWSFMHVSRAEIDAEQGTDPAAPEVYALAAGALARMQRDGILIREDSPALYAYRVNTPDHEQTGFAAAAAIDAYEANRVRRHELTRPNKEDDRARQIQAVGAQTGPVLTAHPGDAVLDGLLAEATNDEPIADAMTADGARHRVWAITDTPRLIAILSRLEAMDAIYIADGHHRSAAAARVYRQWGGCDRFLVISFPVDQLRILDYNRVVRDLNGLTPGAFLDRIAECCAISARAEPVHPDDPHTFGMFVDGSWYAISLHEPPAATASPIQRLAVSLLQDRILAPVLGIGDPRLDPRIDFVGGGRGLEALRNAVQSGEFAVAFSLHPTRFNDIVEVADAGLVMPPKSTWFEPKLADGLVSLPITEG